MRFAAPSLLWLLWLAPLLLAFLWWAWRKKQRLISQFVQSRLLAVLTVGVSTSRQKLRMALLVAAVTLLILTLARPQWGFAWEEAKQRGLDIIVAIDTSRSMLATDVAPNRLTRAKLAALDLQRLAKNDRLGLVAFAGSAFLQCPLSLDDEAYRQSVNALDVKVIPQGGTALAEAIQTALTAFKEKNENLKILVLFTDGEDHDGGAVAAAEEAARHGLRIFPIGVGTPNGELLQTPDESGRLVFLKDEQGNAVKSRLDQKLLEDIARSAQGFYLQLSGAKTIETLYANGIAPLPKTDFSAKVVQRFHERFQWPLGLTLVVLLLEMFLPERKRVPRTDVLAAAAANAELRKAVAVLILLAVPALAWAGSAKALREYKAGKYENAFEEYERLSKRKPDDARLHFNTGTTAFRTGRFDEAARELQASLATTDWELQQKSYYNLGNSRYRQGVEETDAAKKKDHWESAIRNYESALKLNAQDPDAKFNLEFIKKKLEELKQQQEQQKKEDKNQSDPDQSQDDQQDKSKDKSDPKKDSKKKEEDQQQQQKKDQQEQQKKSEEQKAEEKKQQEAQPQTGNSKNDKSDQQPDSSEAAKVVPMQMTPQQAQQLLDAQKSDEKAMIFIPPGKTNRVHRKVKDW